MKNTELTIASFLSLVRAGLWEQDVRLDFFGELNFQELHRLAQEQALVGLVAAGLEKTIGGHIPKEVALSFVGEALQLEQRNTAMNSFIAVIVEKMKAAGIYTLLLKGQGIAQCYERPLWRSCGDVDFFLSADNYSKSVEFLKPLASKIDEEDIRHSHYSMNIGPWVVELHGTLHAGLWRRMDKVIDEVRNEVFCGGNVRSWQNGSTQVFLPSADEDVVFVFSHILQHFFKEGIGLRQICDWCRLLWTYKGTIDKNLLEFRLRRMGVMTEWHSFAYLAVNSLGMPVEAMLFYSPAKKWERKAGKVLDFIFETGNFGHNRDYSYYKKYPYLVYKTISLWKHLIDGYRFLAIFPFDSVKVTINRIRDGFLVALKEI